MGLKNSPIFILFPNPLLSILKLTFFSFDSYTTELGQTSIAPLVELKY